MQTKYSGTDRSIYISKHGTNYKWGTLFFPEQLKIDTELLYAFVRVVDDIVDENPECDYEEKLFLLDEFERERWNVYDGGKSTNTFHLLLHDFALLAKTHRYERSWIEAFFDAMRMDCNVFRYETYSQLQKYMYGSAEVIGLMMTAMIGYKKNELDTHETLQRARRNGEAMQYTNFLRDIREDYQELNRIYIPSDRLAQANLSHEDVIEYCTGARSIHDDTNTRRAQFMINEIHHTRTLYAQARPGVKQLDAVGRLPVVLASNLYARILKTIEENDYDVFGRNVRNSGRVKGRVIVSTLLNSLTS